MCTAPELSFTCSLCFVEKISNSRVQWDHIRQALCLYVFLCLCLNLISSESYSGLLVTTRWKGQISIFTKREIKMCVQGEGYIVPLAGFFYKWTTRTETKTGG